MKDIFAYIVKYIDNINPIIFLVRFHLFLLVLVYSDDLLVLIYDIQEILEQTYFYYGYFYLDNEYY